MNVFVCSFDCDCHPKGVMVIAAFNRGHAVKMIGKRLLELGLDPDFDKKSHPVEPFDLTSKKGCLKDFWCSPQ